MARKKTPEEKAAAAADRAVVQAREREARAAIKRMNKKPRCVECDSWNVRMGTGSEIYPHRLDLHHLQYWICECGAYVGCVKGSDYTPLGRPANAATRSARQAAMAILEPIWTAAAARDEIHLLHARKRAYRWLAEQLGVAEADGDINMMSAYQANRAVEICQPFVKRRR